MVKHELQPYMFITGGSLRLFQGSTLTQILKGLGVFLLNALVNRKRLTKVPYLHKLGVFFC